jgi:hypothetical protein
MQFNNHEGSRALSRKARQCVFQPRLKSRSSEITMGWQREAKEEPEAECLVAAPIWDIVLF